MNFLILSVLCVFSALIEIYFCELSMFLEEKYCEGVDEKIFCDFPEFFDASSKNRLKRRHFINFGISVKKEKYLQCSKYARQQDINDLNTLSKFLKSIFRH